jgi:cytochrome c
MHTVKRAAVLLVALLVATVIAGCGTGKGGRVVPGGDADRGARLIERYGCGGCHTIPGIRGAKGRIGPELEDVARRRLIAGRLQNTPENLMRWIQNPQRIDPGTVMPDLGVTKDEARDIASYLYDRT